MQGGHLLQSAARRRALVLTLALLTACYTWSSVRRLSELTQVESELPAGAAGGGLLQRAEANIASHLHGAATLRGGVTGGVAGGAGAQQQKQPIVLKQQEQQQQRDGAAGGGAGDGGTAAGGAAAGSKPQPAVDLAKCNMKKNTDYWGDALVWGNSHKVDSAGECCAACLAYKPKSKDDTECNVWVYCEDPKLCGAHYRECWLKHLAHPSAVAPAKEGPDVGWTTGLMAEVADSTSSVEAVGGPERNYHVVITAAGTAVHWQSRVAYYWYKKVQKQCEERGNCQMGGFTRLLHTGQPDDLMNEIPTWVAQPLPPEHPDHGYIVLNRPYALLQWVKAVTIPEKYVLMSEPDHLWLKPMPNLMKGENPAAFPFFYIEPAKKEYRSIVETFLGPLTTKEAEQIAPIGNAPTMMSWEDMKRVMPHFFNLSISVHNDPAASKEWGWVQEMYAFTLSCYKAGIRNIGLHLKMMSQPPWDEKLEPYYILHYTYGMDYTLAGEFTPGKYGEWRFDKRSYAGKPPPRNLGEPPTGMKNELVRHLIHAINEATSKIPGWDDYERTGVATQLWDGVL